jgi:hypothetical protein
MSGILTNIMATADKMLEEQQGNLNDNHFEVNSYL